MYWIKHKLIYSFGYYLHGGEGSCYHGRLKFTSEEEAEKWLQHFEIERFGANRENYKIIECKSKGDLLLERLIKIFILIILVSLIVIFKSQISIFLKFLIEFLKKHFFSGILTVYILCANLFNNSGEDRYL